jgi:hypothetical protein
MRAAAAAQEGLPGDGARPSTKSFGFHRFILGLTTGISSVNFIVRRSGGCRPRRRTYYRRTGVKGVVLAVRFEKGLRTAE